MSDHDEHADGGQSPNSFASTHGYEVEAAGQLLRKRSSPEERRWLYAYRVRIANVGGETARLQSRRWVITDGNGETRVVEGAGVVGEHPRLEPGDSFEYRSMCDLETPWGTMEGEYTFTTDGGDSFAVQVGRFFLVESAENAIVAE
ncbi:MAG: Co2+/Mg2+ efflux protein ApaG [Planctomycetota bacterium]